MTTNANMHCCHGVQYLCSFVLRYKEKSDCRTANAPHVQGGMVPLPDPNLEDQVIVNSYHMPLFTEFPWTGVLAMWKFDTLFTVTHSEACLYRSPGSKMAVR